MEKKRPKESGINKLSNIAKGPKGPIISPSIFLKSNNLMSPRKSILSW